MNGTRRDHRSSGNVPCTDASVAMMWFLVVRMKRSAGLARWLFGGTNWTSQAMEGDVKKSRRVAELSLSVIRFVMSCPKSLKNLRTILKEETYVSSLRFS